MKKGIVFLFLATFLLQAHAQVLVDGKATKETRALFRKLQSVQGKSILFGHQDDTAYGIAWWSEKGQSDTKKAVGSYPAVYGWDVGHIELGDSVNLDNVSFAEMRQLIKEADQRGGINTISWHLNNPYTGGSSWDVTSNKVVQSILPNGSKHVLYTQWLDKLAAFMNSLKTDDGVAIPILFRPFHEHTGSWFWWGQNLCTTSEYVSLYQFTVQYLRDKQHVHNLLYIYSPDYVANQEAYFERYPSDAYVDILGLDLYHRDGAAKADEYINKVQTIMAFLDSYAHKNNKVYVFSETGLVELTMDNWFTQVLYKALSPHKPAYVLLWRNAYDQPRHYFSPYPGHPVVPDFKRFISQPDVIVNY